MSFSRNYTFGAALTLAVYVGCYFLFPPSLTSRLGPPTAWSVSYCRFFYPLRWATQRHQRNYEAEVATIDFQKGRMLLMVSPKLGYVLPFHARDAATIRNLHVGDRIRVRVVCLPSRDYFSCHDEFVSYVLVK